MGRDTPPPGCARNKVSNETRRTLDLVTHVIPTTDVGVVAALGPRHSGTEQARASRANQVRLPAQQHVECLGGLRDVVQRGGNLTTGQSSAAGHDEAHRALDLVERVRALLRVNLLERQTLRLVQVLTLDVEGLLGEGSGSSGASDDAGCAVLHVADLVEGVERGQVDLDAHLLAETAEEEVLRGIAI